MSIQRPADSLGEDYLSGIHPSLSEIRADGCRLVPTLSFASAN
jgi:hypothetical protein